MKASATTLAGLLLAGGVSLALATGPTAAADPSLLPQCVNTGGSAALGGSDTECETPGNAEIDATPAMPQVEGPWGDMWGGEGFYFP